MLPPVVGGAEDVAGGGPFAQGVRVLNAAQFLALWTPAETAAATGADPRLLAGCFRVMVQNSVNLDSPELADLLALTVAKGALTPERAAQITAGEPPLV